jgi:hypothetical protein
VELAEVLREGLLAAVQEEVPPVAMLAKEDPLEEVLVFSVPSTSTSTLTPA